MTIVIFILMTTISVFTYMVILGGNKLKTEEERKMEDEEQIEFLKKHEIGGNNIGE